MRKRRKISEASIVPITNDGAIATQSLGEGRLVPVLVVDCSEKVELRDLIYTHRNLVPGDVISTWALPKRNKKQVLLLLEFTKPSNLEVALQFDMAKQGVLVDAILHANALYLQPTESGARVIDGLVNGKIIVEIPDTGFFPVWEKYYTKNLVKKFKQSGFVKSEAQLAAKQHKKMLREIWAKRLKK